MSRTVIVLGAGIVGVSVAMHLRWRELDVVLVDRQGPGKGASGNSGLIQRETMFPCRLSPAGAPRPGCAVAAPLVAFGGRSGIATPCTAIPR